MIIFRLKEKIMKDEQIKSAILSNDIHPSQFQITNEEANYLNDIQDDLFDKINDLNLIFIPSNSDTIMTHLIISQRIDPSITINHFIQLYTETIPYLIASPL